MTTTLMQNFDTSEDATFGLALGDRRWCGVAVRKNLTVELHVTFEDKELVKAIGCRWSGSVWYKKFDKVDDLLNFLQGIIRDDELNQALRAWGGGDKIPLFIESAIYSVITSRSPKPSERSTQKQGEFEISGGDVIVAPAPQPKPQKNPYFCGLAMTEKGVSGFAIKFPFNEDLIEDVKKLAKEAGGKAIWKSDLKCWVVPLSVVNFLGDPNRGRGFTYAKEFFSGFDFSPGALPYFEKYLDLLK